MGVYLLFFLSGICGLIYQVIWVRQFGNIFGNTVYSASLVTAVFMLGLGLGGYLAGRLADQQYGRNPNRLLRYYGYMELAIGICGLLIAFVLPQLEALSGIISSYTIDDQGWHQLSVGSRLTRYLVALVLLLPSTTLMGGTLTLLIRHLVRKDLRASGARIGALYGINTAGAALGAFLVDFSLVPGVGLLATQSLAVVLNLAVGLVALRWAARISSSGLTGGSTSPTAVEEPSATGPAPASSSPRLVLYTMAAILLSGFAAMGLEILWFRFLIIILGSMRGIFSLLLTVILLGIWLGSTAGGLLHRRFGCPALLYIITQAALVVSAITIFLLFKHSLFSMAGVSDLVLHGAGLVHSLAIIWIKLRVILLVVGLPAFLMGFAYPLANAMVQRVEATVGRRAGVLYLANTAGAVAGALATGFLLLPGLGLQPSILVLACCGVLPIIPLYLSMRLSRAPGRSVMGKTVAAALCLACAVSALALWATRPPEHLARRTYTLYSPQERVILLDEGVNETIVISEHQRTGVRRLYTNGYSMSTTDYGAQRYMRAFVHIPLLLQEAPRSVLVICFGVGNTLHAASLHPGLERLEVADLSRNVLDKAHYFRRWNRGVIKHPRVAVYINDGRQHLRMRPAETYDLVTLEPPPIAHAGVSALYTVEFYELVRSRLKQGGYLSQWLPAYQVPGAVTASMVRAFIDVFPHAILLSGHNNELILLGRKGSAARIDPSFVARRLARRPAVAEDLRRVDLGTLTELVGTFAGSPRSLARAARDAVPITDAYPLMEYVPMILVKTVIPHELIDLNGVRQWCPTCFDSSGAATAPVQNLSTYLAFQGRLYASPRFQVTSPHRQHGPQKLQPPWKRQDALQTWHQSNYLRRMFHQPAAPSP